MSVPTTLPYGQLHPNLVNNAAFVKYVDSSTAAQSGQVSHKINGQTTADTLKKDSEQLNRDFREGRMDVVNLDSVFTQRASTVARNGAKAAVQHTAVSAAGGDAYANAWDVVTISAQAKEAMAKQETQVNSAAPADEVSGEQAVSGGTTFTSFAEQFSKTTEGYTNTIREHYAAEHEENLTYDNPSTHIWNKYKNTDSPDFRSDLSEDERAWAYDQELDLLTGGKHLQMSNPYAFADAGGPPTLASAAMQAIQACREQIDQSIQNIFTESGIDIPADASFQLTVDPSDYSIHVTGLEDKELTEAIEQALNRGDNGKNLYDHLKLTTPDGKDLSVDYADGHLAAVDTQQELDNETLSEVKKQAGPTWARYSSTYNPHQEAMNEKILNLDPDSPFHTQENKDRLSAAVRVGAPEIIAEFRARQQDMSLVINQNREIDPNGSIAIETYWRAYVQQAMDARETIKEHYAEAHAENSSYPFMEGLEHLAEKYKRPWSDIFRTDLTEDQRNMYYRQERALLTGARLTLLDPYALASVGGVLNVQTSHQLAMRAVQEKLAELRRSIG